MFHTKLYAPFYYSRKGRKRNGNINQLKFAKKNFERYVSFEAQFYEQDRRSSKQMNITGNETGSRKGIRLKLGYIQSGEIILKQNTIEKKE
jgi:hypothetical protein